MKLPWVILSSLLGTLLFLACLQWLYPTPYSVQGLDGTAEIDQPDGLRVRRMPDGSVMITLPKLPDGSGGDVTIGPGGSISSDITPDRPTPDRPTPDRPTPDRPTPDRPRFPVLEPPSLRL